jgi:non-canonical purine NTP pyrophosphatase (RdgB/HAM1 family)
MIYYLLTLLIFLLAVSLLAVMTFLIVVNLYHFRPRQITKLKFVNNISKTTELAGDPKEVVGNLTDQIEFNKILFLTSNKNKASEAKDIADLKKISNFKILSTYDIKSLPEIQEIQDPDVVNVSEDKVKKMHEEICKLIGFNCRTSLTKKLFLQSFGIKPKPAKKLIIVCEDTGLYLEGGNMGGFPGAFFKQFFDTVGLNVCKIHANGTAIARTSVSIYDGFNLKTFVGETVGTIVSVPQGGQYGFGFDDCFKPDQSVKTFAQMTPQEKNSISMRKIAFAKLFDYTSKTI